jgi:hypothetical protein
MATGGAVDLAKSGKERLREAWRQPNQRGPDSLVHESDLTLDDATDQDLIGVADGARDLEDEMTARMRPPGAVNGPARDGLGQ